MYGYKSLITDKIFKMQSCICFKDKKQTNTSSPSGTFVFSLRPYVVGLLNDGYICPEDNNEGFNLNVH